jgi:hypothetical protein
VTDAAPIERFLPDERPRTYGQCLALGLGTSALPCPYVSCREHLYFAVAGWEDREPDELPATCTLRVADRDGQTLEEISGTLGVTREYIRQLETKGLNRLLHPSRRRYLEQLREVPGGEVGPRSRPRERAPVPAPTNAAEPAPPDEGRDGIDAAAPDAAEPLPCAPADDDCDGTDEPTRPAPESVPPTPETSTVTTEPTEPTETPKRCAYPGCEDERAGERSDTKDFLKPYCRQHRCTVRAQRAKQRPARKPAKKPAAKPASKPSRPAAAPRPAAPPPTPALRTVPPEVTAGQLALAWWAVQDAGGLAAVEAFARIIANARGPRA